MLQSDIQNFYESQVYIWQIFLRRWVIYGNACKSWTLSYLTNKVDRDNNEARLTLKGEI